MESENGRVTMTVNESRCEVTITNAMGKDGGQWDFVIGIGHDLTVFERHHHLYTVAVNGKIKNKPDYR